MKKIWFFRFFRFAEKSDMKRTTSMPLHLDKGNYFKAKPFPKDIFTDFAYEQMRENEKYRDVRKSLRQKTLLSNSKWPARMASELENGGPKKKKLNDKTEKVIHTKPSIVPDFDKSYKRFLRMMQNKKMSKPTTVIQPFSFDDEIDVSVNSGHALKTVFTLV